MFMVSDGTVVVFVVFGWLRRRLGIEGSVRRRRRPDTAYVTG